MTKQPPPVPVHDAPNTLVIEEIWMIVSVDANGNEGVCAAPFPGGITAPLIAADKARLPFILDMARELAKHTRKSLRLIRLHTRTDEQEITP